MRPVVENKNKSNDCCEEAEEVEDGEAVITVSAKRGEAEDDVTSYIFFDFECVQETGVHEPNLCITHKVCHKCLSEEQLASCSQCGQRERVFAGPNTRLEFCKWLFSEQNAGTIVLCHNLKGYDSVR